MVLEPKYQSIAIQNLTINPKPLVSLVEKKNDSACRFPHLTRDQLQQHEAGLGTPDDPSYTCIYPVYLYTYIYICTYKICIYTCIYTYIHMFTWYAYYNLPNQIPNHKQPGHFRVAEGSRADGSF